MGGRRRRGLLRRRHRRAYHPSRTRSRRMVLLPGPRFVCRAPFLSLHVGGFVGLVSAPTGRGNCCRRLRGA
jgi:hypothetical protein